MKENIAKQIRITIYICIDNKKSLFYFLSFFYDFFLAFSFFPCFLFLYFFLNFIIFSQHLQHFENPTKQGRKNNLNNKLLNMKDETAASQMLGQHTLPTHAPVQEPSAPLPPVPAHQEPTPSPPKQLTPEPSFNFLQVLIMRFVL